jgi:hypothetical protein
MDAIGSNHATLSGSGLTELHEKGHGAFGEVAALQGTTSSKINFGPVIKDEFTICSVTRYTGGTMGRILQGAEKNWLHGHHSYHGLDKAGVAYYESWKTDMLENIKPVTNWVVMCGTNAASQVKLVNGVNVGTDTGGSGGVTLEVNQGFKPDQTSNFAIAELVVWDRGLTVEEMTEVSSYLLGKLTVVVYQGCFKNYAPNRDTGYLPLSHYYAECAAAAASTGSTYFGMEDPQGRGEVGQAQCLLLGGTAPAMELASDSECEGQLVDGRRLGGPYRLAVYASSG